MGFFLRLVTGNDPFEIRRCEDMGMVRLEIEDSKGNSYTLIEHRVPFGKGYDYSKEIPDPEERPLQFQGRVSSILKASMLESISKDEAERLAEPWVKLVEKQYG